MRNKSERERKRRKRRTEKKERERNVLFPSLPFGVNIAPKCAAILNASVRKRKNERMDGKDRIASFASSIFLSLSLLISIHSSLSLRKMKKTKEERDNDDS